MTEAIRCLTWLTFSSRLLYIEELAQASAIDINNQSEPTDDGLTPLDIFDLMPNLILVEPELPVSTDRQVSSRTHTVTLAHPSVGEFLLSKKPTENLLVERIRFDKQEAQHLIWKSCWTYLYHFNVSGVTLDKRPLLRYAW